MAGDAGTNEHGTPVADGFLRFLLPAPKPRAAAAPARLVPPHRLVAPPRPDERLFIVPPTRPSWLPPHPSPSPRPPPPPPPQEHTRPLHDAARSGRGRKGPAGAFPPNARGGRAGPERRDKAAPKEKKAWVAVARNAGDEDRAVASEGYSGGIEAEDQLQLEGDQDDGFGLRRLLDHHDDDTNNSLPVAGNHECPHGAGDRPTQHPVPQPSQEAPRPRVSRMRRRQVERRHDIDAFTPGLLALYDFLKPSEEHSSKQQRLVGSLAKCVSREWPHARLHLYGSCANSFGTSHSDVDVCLQMEIGTGRSVAEILLRLAEILRAHSFDNVEAITSARVPIVRMTDPGSGFSCDICINNLFAVANTKLLKDYAQVDQRLLQLAFLVKHWAKLRGVNETYRGTLSSYAYVLMCISFLQLREPKILPCLQAMEPTYTLNVDGTECAYYDEVGQLNDFGAENKESIAELLWAFFHYWAFHHDYRNDVISVRFGNTISKQEKNWTTRIGNDRHLMCIEDPFETAHDLGRVVDRQTIRILRKEFERAAAVLQYDSDPCVTLFEPYDQHGTN